MTIRNLNIASLNVNDINANLDYISQIQLSDWPGTIPESTVAFPPKTANYVFAGPASGQPAIPTWRAAVAADIPNLDASKITTGQLALARGGTHADLSATGPGVLLQATLGADITVGSVLPTYLSGLTCFVVYLANNAGTLQHAIYSSAINAVASNYASKVTGASATLQNTPQVAAGVDFTTGVGVDAAATQQLVFNTAAQTSGDEGLWNAYVAFNSAGTDVVVDTFSTNINVNGTTRRRVSLTVTNATTGAGFPLTVASIAAGKIMAIKVFGFFA